MTVVTLLKNLPHNFIYVLFEHSHMNGTPLHHSNKVLLVSNVILEIVLFDFVQKWTILVVTVLAFIQWQSEHSLLVPDLL